MEKKYDFFPWSFLFNSSHLYPFTYSLSVYGANFECALYDYVTVIISPCSEGVIKDLPRFMRLYHYQ